MCEKNASVRIYPCLQNATATSNTSPVRTPITTPTLTASNNPATKTNSPPCVIVFNLYHAEPVRRIVSSCLQW